MSTPTDNDDDDIFEQDSSSTEQEFDHRADSTKKGYKVGTKPYNIYASENNCKKLEEIMLEDCVCMGGAYVVLHFRKFFSFLLKRKKKDGSNIKPDVQLQYLSNAINFLRFKFKRSAPALHKDYDENRWYSDLYSGLRARGRAEAVKEDVTIKEKFRRYDDRECQCTAAIHIVIVSIPRLFVILHSERVMRAVVIRQH